MNLPEVSELPKTRFNFKRYRLRNGYMRYGQAFCNYFDLHDPALFHMEDDKLAKQVCDKYLENWQTP